MADKHSNVRFPLNRVTVITSASMVVYHASGKTNVGLSGLNLRYQHMQTFTPEPK